MGTRREGVSAFITLTRRMQENAQLPGMRCYFHLRKAKKRKSRVAYCAACGLLLCLLVLMNMSPFKGLLHLFCVHRLCFSLAHFVRWTLGKATPNGVIQVHTSL